MALAYKSNTSQIILQDPMPGTLGNIGQNKVRGGGAWSLDANMGKTFRIRDEKSLQVRVDATNAMNHPVPGSPNLHLSNVVGAGITNL